MEIISFSTSHFFAFIITKKYLRLSLYLLVIANCFYVAFDTSLNIVNAQDILIDGSTQTTPGMCSGDCIIEGGLLNKNNLFHSFTQLNIRSGSTVRFKDPGVTNIINRVTGSQPSNINGLLEVAEGNANLFLINPSGILFGPEARLSIKGSFVATTANSIQFGNQGLFRADKSQIPRLSVNPSALVFNNGATAINVNNSRLNVPINKSLLLVGGDVNLDGASLMAVGGRIEIGGLSSLGTIDLDIDSDVLQLKYSGNSVFSDISLIESMVDVTANTNTLRGGGFITINAKNITISNSNIFSGIDGALASNSQSGDITLHANGEIEIFNGSVIDNSVLRRSIGNSGNISVRSHKLSLEQSEISASTFGNGNAGNIAIETSDSVVLASGSFIASNVEGANSQIAGANGNGGTIKIDTGKFSLLDGSQIVARIGSSRGSNPGGVGKGGSIQATASEFIYISGFNPQEGFSSGLVTSTAQGAIGPAGNISVDTQHFRIANGAIVSAQTFNSSQGGDITISANKFEALRGGQVLTTTTLGGDAGTITLNISDLILLSGEDPTFNQRQENFSGRVQNEGSVSGLFASSRPESQGQAGDIIIDPQTFIIRDGAQIVVSSQGSSPAGNISLQAGNLTLEGGTISATSTSGEGGNINLLLGNLLFLSNNSNISASAGNQNTRGNGGNVTISTNLLIARDDSNITANAFTGNGGSVQINTLGLFRSSDSDITASSNAGGVDGVVEINNPEVDPSQSLTELPETVEPPQEIAKGCRPGQSPGGSSFTHVGRGGLPLGPHQTQTPDTVWQDLRSHNLQPTSISSTDSSPTSLIPTPPPSIIEAQGWTKDSQGRIYLTANVSQPTQSPQPIPTC